MVNTRYPRAPSRAKSGPSETIVRQHHDIRRIMTKNLARRGSFELAAESGIGTLAEFHQFPAPRCAIPQDRWCDGAQLKWPCALPFFDEMFEDRGSAPQRDGFGGESAMRGSVQDDYEYSSTSAVMSSRTTPPSTNASRVVSSTLCSSAAPSLAFSRRHVRSLSVSKNAPSAFSASVNPSL